MLDLLRKKMYRYVSTNEVTLEELKIKQMEGAKIIDVRGNREYKEWHIDGSINIPEYEIDYLFQNLIKDKNAVIIVYCSSGYRSKKAYIKIKKMGYTKVYNLYGGIENY